MLKIFSVFMFSILSVSASASNQSVTSENEMHKKSVLEGLYIGYTAAALTVAAELTSFDGFSLNYQRSQLKTLGWELGGSVLFRNSAKSYFDKYMLNSLIAQGTYGVLENLTVKAGLMVTDLAFMDKRARAQLSGKAGLGYTAGADVKITPHLSMQITYVAMKPEITAKKNAFSLSKEEATRAFDLSGVNLSVGYLF